MLLMTIFFHVMMFAGAVALVLFSMYFGMSTVFYLKFLMNLFGGNNNDSILH